MPNLLPDWLPWIHPAGRLIWFSLVTVIGIAFVVALIKPPVLKRPFPTRVGVAIFFVIIVGGLLLARFVSSLQTLVIWGVLVALVGHAFLMVVSRAPRDAEQQATWAECFAGALGVFALLTLGYAIVPHEWLTYANSYLEWGDGTKFIWKSSDQMLFLPFNWPFSLDYPALRDIVVSGIYGVLLGLNVVLWVMWQKRLEVKPEGETAETAPARQSRFGRPLRAWSARRAEQESATAGPPAGPTAAPSGSGGR